MRTLVMASLVLATAAIAPKSGAQMCALTPADFQSGGIRNVSKPTTNVQDGGASVYCVYAGKSAATGGVELDVFNPAGGTVAEAKDTFQTAISEGSSGMKPVTLAGADDARWSGNVVSGGPPFATMAVRRGTLVFTLGIPAGSAAQKQLTDLAVLVLGRF